MCTTPMSNDLQSQSELGHMKKSEIQAGQSYTDGKGNVRKVIAEGPENVLYDGQMETDNIRYCILAKKRGPYRIGSEHNSTRSSFAAWAKHCSPVKAS